MATVDELRDQAREAGISGTSSMNKAQLEAALNGDPKNGNEPAPENEGESVKEDPEIDDAAGDAEPGLESVQATEALRREDEAQASVPDSMPGEVGAETDPSGPGPLPARSAPVKADAKMRSV